jgi:hypothetical protein
MNRLKSILGHTWAILALPIMLATFMGLDYWAKSLAKITDVEISPWFSGGEIIRTLVHENYKTILHRPVFDGLFGERKEGFVQVNWVPLDENLPPVINEEIDIDRDGTNDFHIQFNTLTNRAYLTDHSDRIIGIEEVYSLGKERAVRVELRNSSEISRKKKG